MMPTLNPKDAAQLPKILGMLGSAHEGEVMNTVRKLRSMLTRNGMEWSDLARVSGGTHTGPSRADVDGAFDRGYRRGLADGAKAMKDEIEKQKAREQAYEDNRPKADPRARDAPGSSRHWPPDDDIWFGQCPPKNMTGYGRQIDQLDELWAIETRLSDWEHGFVQSLAEQIVEKGVLSGRQQEVLDSVYDRKVKGVRR
jgi:hypothetical protein